MFLNRNVKLNLCSHISQWNLVCFHSKLSVFDKNSRLVFKSRCEIESFVTYLTMKSCWLFYSKLRFLYKNSSLVVKSRCENLFSHISQWNPVNSFIQSYEYLIRIQDLFSNLDFTRCKIESFVTKLFCPFKSRCKLECFVTYLKM